METRFITWILLVFYACINSAFAQQCAEDFSAIDESCVKLKEATFNEKPLVLNKDMVDHVYFYRTNLGHLGKLQVISVTTDKENTQEDRRRGLTECVFFFSATTFDRGKTFTPTGQSLNIKSEFNIWTEDSVGLDRNGPYDLRLERDGEQCVIKPLGAKIVFYQKMSQGALFGKGSLILFYAALFLVGLAVFLVTRSSMEEENKFKASETLEEADQTKKSSANDFVLKYSRPFFKRYFTPVVTGMRGRQNLKAKYRRKLANAGLAKELTPEDFFAFKLFLILGFPLLFIAFRVGLSETWPLTLIPILAVVGFFYPNIWLTGRINNRKDEMLRGMPFIVDMLALSVEAGLDFMAAIQKVIEKAPASPLVEEFETMIKETKIGSTRAEGLRQLSWRTDVLAINSFCATLIAADSVGASIGPILKQLSTEMRQKRSADAEKKGATAATKILFPMIMFIMPAVFIAIAGPMLVRFISGGTT